MSDQELPPRGYWYFNVGWSENAMVDGNARSWEDNRRLGFVSAGRLEKSSREINRLQSGDHIFVYLNGSGYVGYGRLLDKAKPAKEVILPDGSLLQNAQLQSPAVVDYADEEPGLREYAIPVEWIRTYDEHNGQTFPKIFFFRGAVCRIKDTATLDFLTDAFGAARNVSTNEPKVWIEKTKVERRPDRTIGEHRLGKALWSPKAAKNGSDRYRFMRDVKPGDIILHLTDNRGFTGISQVAALATDFVGVSGTEWAGEPAYRVTLEHFKELQPPLLRDVFLAPPFRERLLAILNSGQRNVFYQSNGDLRQGAYLTPAPPAVLRVLNDAYMQAANKPLIDGIEGDDSMQHIADEISEFDDLVKRTYWTEPALSEIINSLRRPIKPARQIILAGPPGTGKTFIAQELVAYLTKANSGRTKLVQFHPSYSYEQFVEGLRPVAKDGAIEFRPQPGLVLELAELCRASNDDFYMIIDEFNRANLPRVLGELMYLFEYRDKSIDLPYTRDFSLPPNLSFIATMNTADRSIRSIDLALRRRFEIFECKPDPDLLDRYYSPGTGNICEVPDLSDGLRKLNEKITSELDEHHTIGHTFFLSKHFSIDDLQTVWSRQIFPLLSEFFYAQPISLKHFTLIAFWPNSLDATI